MGRKCSVYNCRSGYDSRTVSIYRFPENEHERQQWISCIPNKFTKVTKHMGVCARHWPSDTPLLRKNRGRYPVPLVPPSIFHNYPESCVPSHPSLSPRSIKKSLSSIRDPAFDEMSLFRDNDRLKENTFLDDFKDKFSSIGLLSTNENLIVLQSVTRTACIHAFSCYFTIECDNNDFSISCELYCRLKRIHHPSVKSTVRYWSELEEVIHFVQYYHWINDQENCEFLSMGFGGTVDHPKMAQEDERVKVLKREYLLLYQKFQHLKELARTDLDLLSLSVDLVNVPDAKAELDRVHELVHVVMEEEISPQMDPFDQELCEAGCEVVETDQMNSVENLKTDNMKLVENSPVVKTLESGFESSVNGPIISTNSAMKLLGLDRLLAQMTSIFTEQEMIDAFGRFLNEVSTIEKDLSHTLRPEDTDIICASQKKLEKTPNQETKDLAMDTMVTAFPTNDLITLDLPEASTPGKRSKQPEKKTCSRKSVSLHNPSQQMTFKPGNANNVKKASGEKCEPTEERLAQTDHVAVNDARTLDTSTSCQNLITTTMPDIEKKDNEKKESTTTDIPIFTCVKCGETLDDRNTFNQHRKTHAREDNTCTACGQQCSNKSDLKRHMGLHSSEKPFICNICGKRFHVEKYLKIHVKRHNKNEPIFYCEVCGKPFAGSSNLNRHMESHREKKILKCSYCDKQYTSFNTLSNHERQHKEHFPHLCSKCGRGFKLLKQLIIHERIHIGESPYFACPICPEKFSAKGQISIHKRTHMVGIKVHNCSICEKPFNGRLAMAIHMLTHTEDLRFCILCQQVFDSSSDLQSHVTNTHLVEKPFECTDCGKLCSSMSTLYRHRANIHLKKKNHQCETCGRKFYAKNSYNHHVQSHQGIKPWKCSVCGKEYTQKVHLGIHMWTHRTDKRYNCEDCGRGFNERRLFLSHRKTCHQDHQNSSGINDSKVVQG